MFLARTVPASLLLMLLLAGAATSRLCGQTRTNVNVLTYHNDLARTGQNLNETVLKPANVNAGTFGELFTNALDGWVFAQPLYMEGVSIPGQGVHNVVFVATMNDSVYAFDADNIQGANAAPLWHASFINPAAGITPVPLYLFGYNNPPLLGITSTPVIDPATGTIYVVAKTRDTSVTPVHYVQWLCALDIATGESKFGGPVEITASYPGTGSGSSDGMLYFDPYWQFQRSGLALLNGVVYIAFASQGDEGPYHGWVLGYDAQTLGLVQTYVDTPNTYQGGIWMSGAAPAADPEGSLYLLTGNGTFTASTNGFNTDFGDSFLKLTPGVGSLVTRDYFTPSDQGFLNGVDGDLGSGGVVVLPDEVGSPSHPRLVFGGGKDGQMFLVNRDHMGGYNPLNDDQIVETVNLAHSIYGMPAYFNHTLYFSGVNDALRAYSISDGLISTNPVSQAADVIGAFGPTPGVSASGTSNGIVWIIQTDAFNGTSGAAILRAYAASNLAVKLYSSTDAGSRDKLGVAQKFSVPTIANGKVYVATAFGLSVFGNLGAPVIAVPPQSQTVDPGFDATFYTAASGTQPLSYQWYHGTNELAGQTNTWLTLNAVSPGDTGIYTVKVSNAAGSSVSEEAALTFVPPPVLAISPQGLVTVQGQSGKSYAIQYTDDLSVASESWSTLTVVSLTNSVQTVTDVDAVNQSQRFYRALSLPY